MIEPAGQADSTWDGIDFSNDVAVVSEDEIWPDHPWQIIADFFAPRKFDQLFRFTRIEIARYPVRLLPFDAKLIELVTGALKNKQPMTKLIEFSENFFVDRKCVWRKEPLFFSEKALLWECGADCG